VLSIGVLLVRFEALAAHSPLKTLLVFPFGELAQRLALL
jgi:hypothetical protein